jgi:argininosuccinate lyase
MSRLWDKGSPLDSQVLQFTAGEDHALDERLVDADVRASIAHTRMLLAQGLLATDDAAKICAGLEALGAEHARGEWHIELADEDGQTALETRLTARIGPAGARVHLGRSRNDQLLTALRLYMRDALNELAAGAAAVAAALERLVQRQGTIALPGYTHMQQAMPSSVAQWAGGYAAELRDDADGLRAVHRRTGKNPLGSAAGYGTPGLALDRAATTRALGFDSIHEPATAVQLSRGKAEAQLLFECTLLMQDLGRLTSDLLLFYTQEFAFITLPDAYTTGSSIMPQKRNADVFELLRARGASALACLVEALTIYAKLPSGYQRDLQLLKAPLFRGIDLCRQSLEVCVPALDALQFQPERVKIDPAVHATSAAYALVKSEGIPFRDAYRRVAAQLSRHRS